MKRDIYEQMANYFRNYFLKQAYANVTEIS